MVDHPRKTGAGSARTEEDRPHEQVRLCGRRPGEGGRLPGEGMEARWIEVSGGGQWIVSDRRSVGRMCYWSCCAAGAKLRCAGLLSFGCRMPLACYKAVAKIPIFKYVITKVFNK